MSEKSFQEQVQELPTQPPRAASQTRTEWSCESISKNLALQIAKEADEERAKTRDLLMGVYSVAKHALAIARSYVSDQAAVRLELCSAVRVSLTGLETS